ncbi:MAG: cytochrome c4 [Gammaproteobacteria bacterium]|nr:cytochrome c4 [Gammaproteobacteria bacterium]
MTAKTRLLGIALATLLAPTTWAAGSAEAGAAKAAVCLACHGPNGNGLAALPDQPKLAGQGATYTLAQLKAFHDGKRLDASGRMPPMAMMLSDQDMEDLAAYFMAQVPEGAEADPAYWQAGQKLFAGGDRARQIPACTACHGPTAEGTPTNGYPALRAQSAIYTVAQLNSYAAGTRYATDAKGASAGGANAAIMQTIARRLSADDIRDLAAYIQGVR